VSGTPLKRPASVISREAGFTIPELISVMIVTVMFSGLIIFFAFQFWSSTATLSNDLETFVSRLTAGDRLRESINSSSGLINQNSITDANVGYPDPAYPSGGYWNPLHAAPATVTMGAAGTYTPVLYYKSPSIDTSGNIVLNGTQPYEDEFVLYLDGDTKQLRMRVLANSTAPANRAVTSCPASLASITCPNDRLVGDNISSVSLRYFSRSGNLIDYTSIIDPLTGDYIGPDMPSVEVVELTFYVYKKSTLHGGANTSNQNIIRIALRNK